MRAATREAEKAAEFPPASMGAAVEEGLRARAVEAMVLVVEVAPPAFPAVPAAVVRVGAAMVRAAAEPGVATAIAHRRSRSRGRWRRRLSETG